MWRGSIMDIKTMVLGFLMRGSMTGYELKKRFSLSFSFFSALSYGSIYPALKKLEQEGLITLKVEVQDGSPNRKVYTITDSGRKVFLENLRTPFTLERQKSAFLARLFFFAHLTREERLTTSNRYLESIREMQETLEALEPEIRDRADEFQYLSYTFGIRFFDDLARNVKEVVQELEGKYPEDKIPSPKKGTIGKGKEGAP
jgi:DNA-binding PadR family transcriptional regulator